MDQQTKDKIIKWIFENHEHHEHNCGDDECGGGCVDSNYPYVNSLELEKFINSL